MNMQLSRYSIPLVGLVIGVAAAHAQTGVQTIATYSPVVGDTSVYYTNGRNSLNGAGVSESSADAFPLRGLVALDADGDGKKEIVATDYTGGGRVHVFKLVNGNQLELIWSSAKVENLTNGSNPRSVTVADLDNDGKPEILAVIGGTTGTPANRGLNIWEYNGDGTWGGPGNVATYVYNYEPTPGASMNTEEIQAADVDGDGITEVIIAHNGPNATDGYYIISLEAGDIGSGFESFKIEPEPFKTKVPSTSNNYSAALGGGSPESGFAADLNGDGKPNEMVFSAINGFQTTILVATGPDTYRTLDTPNSYHRQLSTSIDDYSIDGVVADVDKDGKQEVYLSSVQYGHLFVVTYPKGDPVTSITGDNVRKLSSLARATFGMTAGDLNGDGRMSIYTSGTALPANATGNSLTRVWEFEYNGTGDAGDSTSYTLRPLYQSSAADQVAMHKIVFDSAGAVVRTQLISPNPFVVDMDYAGDLNGNGRNDLVIGYQSIPDSLVTEYQSYDATAARYIATRREVVGNPTRQLIRVLEYDGTTYVSQDYPMVTPDQYKLEQNTPNPFNPTTSIRYYLPINKAVTLSVYDVLGREVRRIVSNETLMAGWHTAVWDGKDVAGTSVGSGTYLYRLTFGNFNLTQRMTLVK